MRVVVQVAKNASCTVDGKVVSSIDYGFMLLVGFCDGDTTTDVEKVAKKVQGLRILPDENGKMNLSLKDKGGKILSISQFTLYADSSKGYRPSFVKAMKGEEAINGYNYFNYLLEGYGLEVKCGEFGADMQISFTNLGPTTIIIDSCNL